MGRGNSREGGGETNPSAVCAPLRSPSAWQVLRGAAARLPAAGQERAGAATQERAGAATQERAGAAAEALAAVVHAHARNHADAVRRGAPQVLRPDGLEAGPCARAALWNVDEALWNVDEASSTFCGKLTRSRAVAAGAWVHSRSGARARARGARGDAGGTARPDAPAPALSLSVSLTSFGMGNPLCLTSFSMENRTSSYETRLTPLRRFSSRGVSHPCWFVGRSRATHVGSQDTCTSSSGECPLTAVHFQARPSSPRLLRRAGWRLTPRARRRRAGWNRTAAATRTPTRRSRSGPPPYDGAPPEPFILAAPGAAGWRGALRGARGVAARVLAAACARVHWGCPCTGGSLDCEAVLKAF